ncbi:hypothetical protein CB0940_02046 [Cercospora beticola]|uniref:Uncharacterized protein n=1 Tax=Cercospora beticola TaxID=122368 RepID=A0A2G5ICQ4_CERBT|nr:hypothetical protein CB0940_02046 [Cercospora beticola]PIB02646.1 hypothetical protein CB0940_02046 [Cercospora beticola]WPA97516.1 hypothetical protein RHO25_002126 [Cercospora beticola]CAK1354037.1 unnamed protein product [Cercospora beticola]
MTVTLRHVRDKGPVAEEVQMNAVASVEWSSGKQYLYTQGLNSCTAVAITSERAGILAHIGPSRKNRSGDQNVIDHMQEIIKIYNTGRAKGLFLEPGSVVLAAIYNGSVALPDQVNVVKKVLDRLQLPFKYKEYRVREATEDRPTGETSLIIHCAPGQKPQMYVNEILWETESGNAAESSRTASKNEQQNERPEQTSIAGKGKRPLQGQSSGQQSTQDWNTYASERIESARAAMSHMIAQGGNQTDVLAQVRGALAKELQITEDKASNYLPQAATEQPATERQSRQQSSKQWNDYATSMIQHARAARDRLVAQGIPAGTAVAQLKKPLAQQLRLTEEQASVYLN